jgi:hypothetical protein
LRIVKGDKGTAGTVVAPAGEFKPRTSAKVRFEFAMNIYTEPAAPATETATDSTAPQAKSWRDTLPIHPAAEVFPRMSEAELAALGKDIRKHGLTSPIVLWRPDPKGQALLLDGRGRLDAIEMVVGAPVVVGPPSIMVEGKNFLALNKVVVLDKSVDPWSYIVSANVHRRHLSVAQREEALAKIIARNPEKSDRQLAREIGVDHKTIGRARAKGEDVGSIPHVSSRIDTKGRKQPARKDSKGRKQPARKTATKPPPVSEEVLQQRAAAAERIRALMGGKTRDAIGPASNDEITHKDARIEELQAQLTHFEFQNIALRSEVGELKAVRKPEGEDEDSELGNLLRAWDCASQGAREKFKAHVGLVAVEPAKVMDDGLDIPECLRRAAP